jgi:hypothetical protein
MEITVSQACYYVFLLKGAAFFKLPFKPKGPGLFPGMQLICAGPGPYAWN